MRHRKRAALLDATAAERQAAGLPNYPGQLATVLSTAPLFRRTISGYDRMQVDSYVAWMDEELQTQRRTVREVVAQFREAVGELERSRRLHARTPEGKQMVDVSEQAGRILANAADEAARLAAAGAALADQVVTDAHREARTRLESIRDLRQRVQDWCSAVRGQAELDRIAGRRLLDEAHAQADRLLAEAARRRAEEERAADEAMAARLAAANQQLADVQERTRAALAFLTGVDSSIAQTLTQLERPEQPLNFIAAGDDRIHQLRPTA